jgi:hypothetical protein
MTWIQTIPPQSADAPLALHYQRIQAHYPAEYGEEVPAVVDPSTGVADSITAAHSLIPDAMEHALSTFGVLLSDQLPLSRRQHEMIATVVSALNNCFY